MTFQGDCSEAAEAFGSSLLDESPKIIIVHKIVFLLISAAVSSELH